MADNVWIIGAYMTRFGRYPERDLLDLASEAALGALKDADLTIHDMQVLAAGSQLGGPFGQRLQKQIGQTGIPVYNVMNACATGATAVRVVSMEIKAGEADLGIAVGAEQMGKAGLLSGSPRASTKTEFVPQGRDGSIMPLEGILGTGTLPGIFAQAGMEYASANDGVGFEQFARVAEKNHAHSMLNPLAQYRKGYGLEEIMNSEMISYPNTLLMCSPTCDGSSAVVLCSDARLRTLDPSIQRRAVKISAAVLTTDPWTDRAQAQPDVNTLTRMAADRAYELAGVGPEDLDLVELHDCFATAELIHYDNLRLCEPGGAGAFIDSGAPWRGGTTPVSVSGGLISKGHPIAATGVAQLFEIVTHLRGEAGERQIEGAKVGLAHVIGLGASTCAVNILEKAAS